MSAADGEGAMVAVDTDAYLKERVEKQIEYHARKAAENRSRFRRLAMLSITATSLTPLILALSLTFSPPSLDKPLKVVLGFIPVVLSVIGAVATASLSAFKHRESWITHRSVCEALRRETYLFRFGAGPYAEAQDAGTLFVERAEAVMESEAKEWRQLHAEPTAIKRDGPVPR